MRYILCLLLSLVCTPLWADLQNELTEQQERLTANKKQLDSALRLHRQLTKSLAEVTEKRLAVEARIAALTKQSSDITKDIEIQSRSLVELNANLEQQKRHVKKLFAQTWRMNPTLSLRALLTPSEPSQIARQMAWLKYMVRAQKFAIVALEDLHIRKSQLVVQGHSDLQKHSSAEKKLQTHSEELLRLEHQEKDKKQQLESSITEFRRNQAQLSENVRELRTVISNVQKGKNYFSDEADGSRPIAGRLVWPVDGKAAESEVRKRFGSQRGHKGILIIGKGGAEVRATHQGRIVFADYLKGWGATVVVKHRDNMLSVYAYNESLTKRPGDFVEAGEPLATLSAYSALKTIEAPVLYFAIFQKGRSLNPAVWLASQN